VGITTERAGMKIDTQRMTITNKFASLEQDKDRGFDYLLDDTNKKPKSDDYYWQHQNQLQRSDLTFNELGSKPKNQVMFPEKPALLQPEEKRTDICLMPEVVHINMPLDGCSSKLTHLSEFEMKQVSPILDIILQNPTNHSENKMMNLAVSKTNHYQTLMSNKTLPRHSMFKNYQLFLDNNQVELTLNTSHFSKQQTNELQTTIKQWLTSKGYSLKQLIINGVQQ
jgi:hypothetical protein